MTPDPRTPERFRALPKFLVADADERDFVIHCHYPRFIIEYIGARGEPIFIDSEAEYIKNELAHDREPAASIARLMREAGDFFMDQTDH